MEQTEQVRWESVEAPAASLHMKVVPAMYVIVSSIFGLSDPGDSHTPARSAAKSASQESIVMQPETALLSQSIIVESAKKIRDLV